MASPINNKSEVVDGMVAAQLENSNDSGSSNDEMCGIQYLRIGVRGRRASYYLNCVCSKRNFLMLTHAFKRPVRMRDFVIAIVQIACRLAAAICI